MLSCLQRRLQSAFTAELGPLARAMTGALVLIVVGLTLWQAVAPRDGIDTSGLPLPVFVILVFFVPSLAEELFFRVALIPRADEMIPLWPRRLLMLASIAAFVFWHPLQALFWAPERAGVFFAPVFMAYVAVLGIVLTLLYVRTQSIWPCVVLHWLVVVVWQVLLGGDRLFSG